MSSGYPDYQVAALLDGELFRAGANLPAVGAGATVIIGFRTGNNAVYTPSLDLITASTDTVIGFYEGDSFTGGTAVTPIARNRTSSATSPVPDVRVGVTATPTPSRQIGATRYLDAVKQVSILDPEDAGFVLKPNTDYLVTITNQAAQPADILIATTFARVR